VARRLQEAGLATLLMDLLTTSEGEEDALTAHLRFDIGLLARRFIANLMEGDMSPDTVREGVGTHDHERANRVQDERRCRDLYGRGAGGE
jgi:hypothetical protein